MTVPDGAPPVKAAFDRLTSVIACPGVTLMARLLEVLAARETVGITSAARDRKKK
jgi:hypothetical protein